MTSPLPRTKPEPPTDDVPTTASDGTPWSHYVRRVDLLDRDPQGPEQPPVHVLSKPVLFDGVIAPAGIAKEGIVIDVGLGGTVVTMHVRHEDVQIGSEGTPWTIGGRRVITPVGHGWDWVPVDPDDPEGWIVCSIYVAEVVIR